MLVSISEIFFLMGQYQYTFNFEDDIFKNVMRAH